MTRGWGRRAGHPAWPGGPDLGLWDEWWRLRPECVAAGCRVFHHPSGHEASPREGSGRRIGVEAGLGGCPTNPVCDGFGARPTNFSCRDLKVDSFPTLG